MEWSPPSPTSASECHSGENDDFHKQPRGNDRDEHYDVVMHSSPSVRVAVDVGTNRLTRTQPSFLTFDRRRPSSWHSQCQATWWPRDIVTREVETGNYSGQDHYLQMVGRASLGLATGESIALKMPLSETEINILRLVDVGRSNQEIADRLKITVGTTKWHLHRIFRKLGVHNRTGAAAKARQLGLV